MKRIRSAYVSARVVFIFCFATSHLEAEPLIVAHRGNSTFAPENTGAAFQAALGRADMVELDVNITLDGEFVVTHDAKVDRTSDGTGTISAMTLEELRNLDLGSWFHPAFAGERILTLEEALNAIIPHAVPLVERKAGSAEAYVAEIHRLGVATNIVLQSFDWSFITTVHQLDPTIPLAVLGQKTLDAATIDAILATGAETAAFHMNYVNPDGIALLKGAGLACFVWTVDGINIPKFIDMGVDGIISNDPALGWAIRETRAPDPIRSIERRMMAYWCLDETAPHNNVHDRYGISDGELGGPNAGIASVDAPDAWIGSSLALDGTNAYVTVPPTTALDINTNAVSLAAWVRLSTLAASIPGSTASIYDAVQGGYGLYLDRAAKELRFRVADTNGHVACPGIPDSRLAVDEWIHVAATYSGASGLVSGQTRIYVNGQLADVHTGNDPNTRRGLTHNVKPGQSAAMGLQGPAGGNGFTGLIDEVAVWARELQPAEIKCLHDQGLKGTSLAAMLPPPGDLLRIETFRPTPLGGIEIVVGNDGPWPALELQRSDDVGFEQPEAVDIPPVDLGGGRFRFDLPPSDRPSEFYRAVVE